MAGGTGGHIFPGLAVAHELERQGWHIHWLGTKERMESHIVPQHGFDISFINIAGLRNKNWKTWLQLPFKLMQSIWQSIKIIRTVNPDVVLGMGGYASAPGGFSAWLLRKPLVLHEQNASAGLSNRCLSKIATEVLSAFPGAFNHNVNYQVVGNPLREDIIAIDKVKIGEPQKNVESTASKDPGPELKKVLVVGGSLGAQVLNETVPSALEKIKLQTIQVWHQSGAGKQEQVLTAYKNSALGNVKITEFIDDMASAYAWADIVICRAGALTVSELAMAGKPAIFVPLPHAVDDHQTKNAQYLVDRRAAKIMPQKSFNAMTLAQTLNGLFSSASKLTSMAKNARVAAHADATVKVSEIIKAVVKR